MSILASRIKHIFSSVSTLVRPTYDKTYFLKKFEKSNDFATKCKLVDKFKGRGNELLSWLREIAFDRKKERALRLNVLDLFRFIPYDEFKNIPDDLAKSLLDGLFNCLNEEDIYIRNYAMCAISRNVQTFKRFPALVEKMSEVLSDKDSAISGQAAELLGKINSPESCKALWSRFLTAGVALDLGTYTRDDVLFNNDLCDVLDHLYFGNDHPLRDAVQARRVQTLSASKMLDRREVQLGGAIQLVPLT